jgi:hypothetical protein
VQMKTGGYTLLKASLIALVAVAATYSLHGNRTLDSVGANGAEQGKQYGLTSDSDHPMIVELEIALRESRRSHAQEAEAKARKIEALEKEINRMRSNRSAADGRPGEKCRQPADWQVSSIDPGSAWQDSQNDSVLLQLDEHLAMDIMDAGWEQSIELRVYDLIAESPGLEGNELIHTSCGSTFCRVEFQHDDAEAESRLLAAVARSTDWSEGYDDFFQYRLTRDENVDGRPGSVFFISRKGFELPIPSY